MIHCCSEDLNALNNNTAYNAAGFTEGPLKTCCGGGGPYNFNPVASCGVRGSSVCTDPSAYTNWDGVHLTEAAYHAIADSILHGPYTNPRLL
jgi:phospholipase/lecithinase/hemolysin